MMRERLSRLGLLMVLLCPLWSCGEQSDGPGSNVTSQSHWLQACAADTDCDQETACVCGVCTLDCGDQVACGDTPTPSRCIEVAEGPVVGLCTAGAQPMLGGICLPDCQVAGDCEEGQSCSEGACVPTEVACDNAQDPGPDFCGDGEDIIPVRGSDGCIERFVCEVLDCPTIEPPDCEPGFAVSESLDENGCSVFECVRVGFDCGGEAFCTIADEFCQEEIPGVPDAEISHTCQPIPEACQPEPTCECVLEEIGFGNAGDCNIGPDGQINISIALP